MELKKYITSFILFAILASACDNSEELMYGDSLNGDVNNGEGFAYTMQFDAPYPYYDGENETRATSSGEWEDGDVIYLFLGGENEAYANATYKKEDNTWILHSDKMLEPCNNSQCSVWYCKGGGKKIYNETSIIYDYLTEAYSTKSGYYSIQNGEIKVTAKLQPFGRRLRFKGEPGTQYLVQGKGMLISYNTIDLIGNSGFFIANDNVWELIVKDNGYTDYRVFISDATTSKLIIFDNDLFSQFSRYFDNRILREGESGCFTIPTSKNLNGWKLDDYVDLGLPSRTIWAKCNVGASLPEEYGDYYAWGETETKFIYDWSTYKWCKGNYNNLTKYCTQTFYGTVDGKTILEDEDDASQVNRGTSWRMPSRSEINELLNLCTWEWITLNGVNGFSVKGPNSFCIFLPASGVAYETRIDSKDNTCFYRSNSIGCDNSFSSYQADYIECRKDYIRKGNSTLAYAGRCCGMPIRPVFSNK